MCTHTHTHTHTHVHHDQADTHILKRCQLNWRTVWCCFIIRTRTSFVSDICLAKVWHIYVFTINSSIYFHFLFLKRSTFKSDNNRVTASWMEQLAEVKGFIVGYRANNISPLQCDWRCRGGTRVYSSIVMQTRPLASSLTDIATGNAAPHYYFHYSHLSRKHGAHGHTEPAAAGSRWENLP